MKKTGRLDRGKLHMKNKIFNFLFCEALLLFAIILWSGAFMYKDNMVAANENVTEAQVQTRTEIPAIPKREEVYEGFNEVTFNNMTTSDREQFVYSDDVYDINVNVNSKQTFTGEISINQTKIDISEEYEK